jgi:pimeloyl-ACP methyl ester carboxylesterase
MGDAAQEWQWLRLAAGAWLCAVQYSLRTIFLSSDTPHTGNTAMLVLDTIEMLDVLGVEKFAVAGHDWGANMAEMLAVGWPDRVDGIAMLSTPRASADC